MTVLDMEKGEKASKAPEAKKQKVNVTPEIRKMWIMIRQAWNTSPEAFTGTMTMLSSRQADSLYDVVKLALFKSSYAEILHEHPELRELVKGDNDRLCMHDVYEVLSSRLGRTEPFPPYIQLQMRLKGGIGRSNPKLSS
jgi:hypothetical protein